jgi:hypothetical protein
LQVALAASDDLHIKGVCYEETIECNTISIHGGTDTAAASR